MDGQNPAPPKKPWNDDSPENTNKQGFPMGSKWVRIGFRPSTVVHVCRWPQARGLPFGLPGPGPQRAGAFRRRLAGAGAAAADAPQGRRGAAPAAR